MSTETEKIQKILARSGLASRREIEKWIAAGRVQINGIPAKLGDRASVTDVLSLDGKTIPCINTSHERKILLYHKPVDEICTRFDPEGRPTVFEHLPELSEGRWIMIGRLDINTSGLLLFTNDGDFANQMMHPRHEVEREYSVRVFGHLSPEMIQNLKDGVELEDGPARFKEIKRQPTEGKNQWFTVVIMEGKNREVRRLFESQGVSVSRLMRIRYGDYVLPRHLLPGQWEICQK